VKRIQKTGLVLATVFAFSTCLSAASITFDLNCVLSGSSCTAFPQSLGSVVVTDRLSNDGVDVTVSTATGGKFIDLYFNVNVTPLTVTSPSVYSNNGFSMAPYTGKFDFGSQTSPSKGFSGNSGQIFSILGTGFTASDFNALDSLGQVNVGIHLQQVDCTSSSCVPGTSSIKVGGMYVPYNPPGDDPNVPEPATMAIVGGGLMGVYWMRRRKA
jgi:hypothetical protein